MSIGDVLGFAGPLLGGMMGSDSAGDAANTQAESSRYAADLQKQTNDQNRADLQPWRDAGGASLRKLSSLLGIGGAGGASGGAPSAMTRDQIYQQMLPQYTTQGGQAYQPTSDGRLASLTSDGRIKLLGGYMIDGGGDAGWVRAPDNVQYLTQDQYKRQFSGIPMPGTGGSVNYDGLNQAVDQRYQSQGANSNVVTQSDPEYGRLLKDFSLQDFQKDPGYEFRLAEGEKGINRASASRGGYDSGATLKALLRYGSDYASGEFNNAYNRDASDKSRAFNFLSGVAGTGQTAANTIANQNQNSATNLGNLAMSEGDARASGIVGGSNAMSGGISSAYNNYQQNQMLKNLMNKPPVNQYVPSYAGTGSGGWTSGYDL